MKHDETRKPRIHVYYTPEIEDISIFEDVLFGIEEEGIPYAVKEEMNLNSLELCYKAAQRSNLAVGIGIKADGEVTLTFNKLKKNEPLFIVDSCWDKTILRNLGTNAGRLVKGIAFK
ncbi:glycerol dehydratase reactivase beta/small subunit family protein [Bacillus tuaregi]|uniref:glycerol dehydratase reactivase beta/small subunit family protein n=1 Tax=Bacillus tuaregi TaxID=1816695 RepID=UPI0008F82A1B|nr:glycerol dehydratase reactivase beta/small subunit family protein [Bacillus tuaregi]